MRKSYVDYIKAIGIILVIMGHVNFANGSLKSWIYSFHMPLFFFATGIVLGKKEFNKDFFLGKVRSLIVPYFVWGVVFSGFSFPNLLKIGYASYHSIRSANSLSSLWFLPVMFLGVFVAQLLIRTTNHKIVLLVEGFACFIVSYLMPTLNLGYLWSIDVVLNAVFFIIMGMLFEQKIGLLLKELVLKSNRENIKTKTEIIPGKKKTNIRKFAWGGVLLIIGILMNFTFVFNPITKSGWVLMASNEIGSPIFYLLAAIGGCIATYIIAIFLDGCFTKIKMLSYIGQNTLIIFVVQKPVIGLFQKLFDIYPIPNAIELLITTIGTLFISCIIALLINSLCPNLAGRTKNVKY